MNDTARPDYWIDVDTRWGKMTINKNDQWVGASLLAYGEFSPGEWQFVQGLVRPGDVALDIGANIGALTLPLAQAVGRRGMVHAFEPQPDVRDLLVCNTGNTPITVHAKAVGAVAGTIKIPYVRYDQPGNFGGVEFGGVDEGHEVDMMTVDGLQLDQLALLKADVEGMEPEVLQGARDTIKRCRPVLYVESDREHRREELLALMDELGYRVKYHLPPLFAEENFRGLKFPLHHFVRLEALDAMLPVVQNMLQNDPPKLAEQLIEVIGEAARRGHMVVSINMVGIPKEWPKQPWES